MTDILYETPGRSNNLVLPETQYLSHLSSDALHEANINKFGWLDKWIDGYAYGSLRQMKKISKILKPM